jgi:hypothetical protein
MLRLAAARTRVVDAIPPRWIEVARQYPVLWMVVAPVVVAVLFIGLMLAFQPAPRPQAALAAPVTSAAAAAQSAQASPSAPAVVDDKPKTLAVAGLEGKSPEQLSVDELLLLNESRAQHKREDAKALSHKLQEQPELSKDEAVQAQLLRFAADPDTAADALGALAQTRSPIGADLLYEVWTTRSLPSTTTELARTLLLSRDVRPSASPALSVAIALRSAESCAAVQSALPQARSDGDRRALYLLTKLNARRGCGEKKNDDCYACLRSQNKEVIASINAVKAKKPPAYLPSAR